MVCTWVAAHHNRGHRAGRKDSATKRTDRAPDGARGLTAKQLHQKWMLTLRALASGCVKRGLDLM